MDVVRERGHCEEKGGGRPAEAVNVRIILKASAVSLGNVVRRTVYINNGTCDLPRTRCPAKTSWDIRALSTSQGEKQRDAVVINKREGYSVFPTPRVVGCHYWPHTR